MSDAAKPALSPPKQLVLREQDKPYWTDLQKAKPKGEWSETDLIVGFHLAQTFADMADEKEVLDTEPAVLRDRWGKAYANPRAAVIETMTKRVVMLLRSLRLGGQDGIAPDTLAKNRAVAKNAQAVHGEVANELLA